MQTGKIHTRGTKFGDVVKNEYEPSSGYCREEAVVTIPAGGLSIGAVLESTSVAGKYTLVVAATSADADAVLIDNTVYELEAGDHTLAIMTDGPAQVTNLTFGADINTPVLVAAAEAALTANTKIKILEQA